MGVTLILFLGKLVVVKGILLCISPTINFYLYRAVVLRQKFVVITFSFKQHLDVYVKNISDTSVIE